MLICEIAAESTGQAPVRKCPQFAFQILEQVHARLPPTDTDSALIPLPRARRHQTPPINKTFTSPSPLLATLTDGTGGALHQQPLLPDVCL